MFKTFCDWKGCENPAPHYQGGGYGFELILKTNDGTALAYRLPNTYHLCPRHLVAHILGHLATSLSKEVVEDAMALSGYFPRVVERTPVSVPVSRPMSIVDRTPIPGDILRTESGIIFRVMEDRPRAPGCIFGLSLDPHGHGTVSSHYDITNPGITYVSREDGGAVEVGV